MSSDSLTNCDIRELMIAGGMYVLSQVARFIRLSIASRRYSISIFVCTPGVPSTELRSRYQQPSHPLLIILLRSAHSRKQDSQPSRFLLQSVQCQLAFPTRTPHPMLLAGLVAISIRRAKASDIRASTSSLMLAFLQLRDRHPRYLDSKI